MPFDPEAAARHVLDQHRRRATYDNLPPDLAPASVAEAYAGQEALHRLLSPTLGPIAGVKIATTTPVMQRLMGIDHPCAGAIFASRIHASPARLRVSDFISLRIECEVALRLGADLPDTGHTGESVAAAVAEAMPAFELVEDRAADYAKTKALSLIVENSWNAGIVLGPATRFDGRSLKGLAGRVETPAGVKEGASDDPLGALAWLANLMAERGRPLTRGLVVMTGSLIPTLPIAPGERFAFTVEGLAGEVVLEAVA